MNQKKTIKLAVLLLSTIILLSVIAGCTDAFEYSPDTASYTSFSMEEGSKMMEENDGNLLIDVRTIEEFNEGHIPDAINIPLDSIGSDVSELLPDKTQILLIYCRSGNRSRQAAEKLSALGYSNIYEIGGIIDWKGDIVIEDLFQYEHSEIDCNLTIEVGDYQMQAYFVNNAAVKELIKKLTEEKEITVEFSDYGSFEKVGTLPWSLPTEDERISTVPGDIVLYEGNKLVIFYGENSWSYTRIAHLNGMTREEILAVAGKGDVSAKLFLDWWDY